MKTPDANPDAADDAWDAVFRQQLGDYTTPPPADALPRILAGASPPRLPASGHWLLPLSLALLLLMSIGGWLFVRKVSRVVTGDQPARPTLARNELLKDRPMPGNGQTRVADDPENPVVGESVPPGPSSRGSALPITAGNEHFGTNRLAKMYTALENTSGSTRHTSASGYRRTPTNSLLFANRQLLSVNQTHIPAGKRLNRHTSLMAMDGTPVAGTPVRIRGDAKNPADNLVGPYSTVSLALAASTPNRLPFVDKLMSRPFLAFRTTANLPTVEPAKPTGSPQASRPTPRRAWFVSLTPLYNYQQIDPIHTDAELVSNIRVARPLATDRLGGRLQLGTDWHLTGRFHLRTGLVYQQLRQSLHYTVQSAQPDSVQIVVVDNQSVRATPVFTQHSYAETITWHYIGVSTDLVWQLNRRQNSAWQHYLTVGTTLGRYVSRGGPVNGFVQLAYGIERPLTPGVRLRLEPTVQLGWQTLTDAAQRLQTRPYGYGIALGLRFR